MERRINRSVTKAHTLGTGVAPFQTPLKNTPDAMRGLQTKDLFEVSKSASAAVTRSLPGGIEGAAKVSAQAGVDGQVGGKLGLTGAAAAAVLHAEATVEAQATAVREFGARGQIEAQAQVEAGAEAQGTARVDLGANGAEIELHGDAFIGARAEASIEGTLGDGLATAEAGVTGLAGFGAEGEISGEISLKKLEFQVQGGLALGLGASVNLEVSIDPSKIARAAGGVIRDRVGDVREWF